MFRCEFYSRYVETWSESFAPLPPVGLFRFLRSLHFLPPVGMSVFHLRLFFIVILALACGYARKRLLLAYSGPEYTYAGCNYTVTPIGISTGRWAGSQLYQYDLYQRYSTVINNIVSYHNLSCTPFDLRFGCSEDGWYYGELNPSRRCRGCREFSELECMRGDYCTFYPSSCYYSGLLVLILAVFCIGMLMSKF